MEEVLEKMGSALIGSENKTEFESLYKNWGRLGNQEERRKQILENQRINRSNKLDKVRGILELVNAVEEYDVFKRGNEKRVHYRPSIYVAGFNRASLSYNNVLMMSEWMVEKPDDFHENWYVSPCPKGVRTLLIANRGSTKLFTKYGQFKLATRTLIPGGSPYDNVSNRSNCCCVLDCFYQEQNNTLYVIDFLAWNNQPMTECDTEFRNFWLQSQFAERPELGVITKKNKLKIVLLPKVQCTGEQFNEFMMKWPAFGDFFPAVDGLLFYHKKAHYTSGETPLVGWLYPYMVPEVLGADITVHEAYLAEKPADYVDQPTFIKQFEENLAKRASMNHKGRRQQNNRNSMDTSDIDDSETKAKENDSEMEADGSSEKAEAEKEMDNSNDNTEDSTTDVEVKEE